MAQRDAPAEPDAAVEESIEATHDEHDTPDTEGDASPPKTREELYERLGAVDDPDAEAPVADPKADEQPPEEDEEPAPEEPLAPEEPPSPTTSEPPETETLLGTVPPDEWKSLPEVTRKRINALRSDRKAQVRRAEELAKREPLTKYAEELLQFASQSGFRVDQEVDDLRNWMSVGALVAKGGEPAVEALLQIARRLGYKDNAASKPAPLPDWLQAKVDALDIDAETAQEIAQRIAPAEQAPPPPPSVAPPSPTGPSPAVAEGLKTVNERAAAAQAKHGSAWARLWPLVQKEMLKSRGEDPKAWGVLFDKSLEIVLERGKPRTPGRPTLAAGNESGSARATPDVSKLKGRERLYAQYTRYRPPT